jgi:lysozyme
MNLNIASELCQKFEGFSYKPYLCPAGIPTIGYGSTYYSNGEKVTLADKPIDEPTAKALLMSELRHTYLMGTLRSCPILATNQSICNAIVDFTYNLGVGRLQTSTLKRKINEQNWEDAKKELMKWTRGNGRILPGLVKRRQAECNLM